MSVTTIKRAAILGVLPILLLLLATCDITDTNTEKKEQPEFEVTNDLKERINHYNGSQKVQLRGAAVQDVDVSLVNSIDPQPVDNETANASNLTYNDGEDRLYIGYKLVGDEHGGGIDIVNVGDVNNISEVASISSSNLDVQEVDYNGSVDALYVAGAMEVGARFSRIEYNSTEIDSETHLIFSGEDSGYIVKSLVAQDDDNVIFIDDEQTIYKYDTDLSENSRETQTANNAEGFRSIALVNSLNSNESGQIHILDQSGAIYRTNRSSFDDLGDTTVEHDSADLDDNTIARLEAHQDNGATRLFAALNEDGFRVLNPSSNTTWDRKTGRHYVSVSAQEIGGQWRVYAASGSTIEVYADDFTGNGGEISDDQKIGEFNLDELSGIGDAQVNQILTIDDKLFVAYGSEGVLVLDVSF